MVDRYYYMALGVKSYLELKDDTGKAIEIVAELLRELAEEGKPPANCIQVGDDFVDLGPKRPSGGMADTADLKSAEETRAGSTPASGTTDNVALHTSIEHAIRSLVLNPREALYLINQLIERVRP